MGPAPLKRRPCHAPPLTARRHFRRVRLASARRRMAALRSWVSRSVASLFRYRCGREGGRDRREGGGAESAAAGTTAPALLARASLFGRAGRGVQPLSGPRTSCVYPGRRPPAPSAKPGVRFSLKAFPLFHLLRANPPTPSCLLGPARHARELPSKSQRRVGDRPREAPDP